MLKLRIVRDEHYDASDDNIWDGEDGVQLLLGSNCRYSFFAPPKGYRYAYERAERILEMMNHVEDVIAKPDKRNRTRSQYSRELRYYRQELEDQKESKRWLARHIIFTAHKFEHGGVMLQRGNTCMWDSCQIGFWVISVENARELYGKRLSIAKLTEKFDKDIDARVRVANAILEGSVYGYIVEDDDLPEGYVGDSCWGFISTGTDDELEAMIVEAAGLEAGTYEVVWE